MAAPQPTHRDAFKATLKYVRQLVKGILTLSNLKLQGRKCGGHKEEVQEVWRTCPPCQLCPWVHPFALSVTYSGLYKVFIPLESVNMLSHYDHKHKYLILEFYMKDQHKVKQKL